MRCLSFNCRRGRAYLFSDGEYNAWTSRGEVDALWHAYCGGYILLLLRTNCWLEIRKLLSAILLLFFSENLSNISGAATSCKLYSRNWQQNNQTLKGYTSAIVSCCIACSWFILAVISPSRHQLMVAAHDKNQKYKEGKFVLERWRIVEEVTEELSLETHTHSNEAETP
ncbi:hypothetical protein CUMW_012180 [Citrus unshiu]|nr:hypothetical protein CUMW_012180 [Citrus unshiu]